jgi:hypothetical protein
LAVFFIGLVHVHSVRAGYRSRACADQKDGGVGVEHGSKVDEDLLDDKVSIRVTNVAGDVREQELEAIYSCKFDGQGEARRLVVEILESRTL